MSVHYLIDPLDVMTPDDNPDHDGDDPRCACDDCDQIAREEEAERVADDWRDGA